MIPVPLAVRVTTSRADLILTRELRSLTTRSVAPGGYAGVTFSLDRPLALQPDDLAYYAGVQVIDTRSGHVVGEGRLEDPGRGAGADGEVWQVAAVGPSAHASDRKKPLIYVDQSLERWKRHNSSARITQTDPDERTDDVPSLLTKFPEGSTAGQDLTATMVYLALKETAQELARVRMAVVNGATSTSWENRLLTAPDSGAASIVTQPTWSSSETILFGERGGSPAITSGHSKAFLRIIRTAASGTATSSSWGEWYNIAVRAILKNASGTDITSGYTVNTVLASEVVKDLLGRLLTKYDGPNATVATTSFAIDQLAYPDGVTPAEVLEDLMVIDPAYYWAAWESNSAGLHRFEWVAWPTTVRYEADVTDGADFPGSAVGLFNAVNVRWRSPGGNIRIRRSTQTVPELTDAGLTREETIDLGDDIASSSIGDQAGARFLAEHKHPPNAGTLTVARPILDRDRGTMVMPWEIKPGTLIRIRGIAPNANSLNVTTRDGVTVFRIVGVDFDASTATAQLELDSYPLTVARALAKLAKKRTRRR